jgi:hypothetical protein
VLPVGIGFVLIGEPFIYCEGLFLRAARLSGSLRRAALGFFRLGVGARSSLDRIAAKIASGWLGIVSKLHPVALPAPYKAARARASAVVSPDKLMLVL